MKINTVLPLFSKYKTEIVTAQEARDNREKLIKDLGVSEIMRNRTSKIHYDYIHVTNGDGVITLSCEELTKFLELFSIYFNIGKNNIGTSSDGPVSDLYFDKSLKK
jgi:hypothetical protein